MLSINIREILYIVTIAETGSITRAADKLFVSQPALSQTIKRIENELGVPLFHRLTGHLKLTQEGECFVSTGIRINKELRDMGNRLQDISSLNGGNLALGIPHHLGAYIVPQALAAYKKTYEKVQISLYEASPNELEKMLKVGSVDLAIMPLPIKDPGICYRPFLINRMVLVMGKDHPLNVYSYSKDPLGEAGGKKRYFDLKNADGASFILGEQGQRIRTASDRVIQKSGISIQKTYASMNVETIKRLVSVNLGITLLPELYFYSDGLGEGVNCYYLEPQQDYPWTIVCAYQSDANLTAAARSFMEVMERCYGG